MGGEYVCTLSPELVQRAKDEINEVPERRAADIEHIRDWLKHQPHINARMDDWTILRFLRGCKFSLERTKEKLDMFYTCKTLCPEWYKNRDPQDKKMRAILELGVLLPLPGYDYLGRKVLLERWALHDPATTTVDMMFRVITSVADVLLDEDEQSSVTGYVVMSDNACLSVPHVVALKPTLARKVTVLWQGRRVMLTRPGVFDPSTTNMDELSKAMMMLVDVWMEEDEASIVTGVVMVEDFNDFSISHLTSLSPVTIKKMMTLFQDGYPMRPKGLNYINTPAAFDTVFNIFRSFMKEKMKKRVHIHGSDMESLYKQVPREMLPVEYGGTNGTVEEIKNYWLQRLDARRDWLLEDEKYCVDESKRPGKPKTSAELFGIEGSFRKLDVD